MVTLGHEDARVLHDELEEAYFAQMAQGGGRWFERRRKGYLLSGYAGLDSPTMSRIARLDLELPDLDAALTDAHAYFGERVLPWCVHVTPFARPEGIGRFLRARGFYCASELTVMTWERPVLPEAAPDVEIVEIGPENAASFTALAVEAFRMPQRYLPPLTDISRAWMENGARAFIARVEGRNAGTAMIAHARGVSAFYNVGTLRPYRRRGVARSLMRRAIEEARKADPARLTLQVARATPAEAMYERMGFEARYHWELFARG